LLLYYITDRTQLGDTEESRCRQLLERISKAAAAGVDHIQLRERDLSARTLEQLAREISDVVRSANSKTKLLINSRIDVALAIGADGVHLRASDISASEARAIWAKSAHNPECVIGVSCHSIAEVLGAESHGADFAVFGPVFGKAQCDAVGLGMSAISSVTRRGGPVDKKVEAGQTLRMPVLALGGVTVQNAADCVRAGAAGVAGIRLFQEGDLAETVARLRQQA
jgi:thiamine-phosphate pyrophosphorylase